MQLLFSYAQRSRENKKRTRLYFGKGEGKKRKNKQTINGSLSYLNNEAQIFEYTDGVHVVVPIFCKLFTKFELACTQRRLQLYIAWTIQAIHLFQIYTFDKIQ